ncbi:methyltransferase domain-containing protein [Trichocoleus sp. DQ-A3]|uniref:class I SAM-dependent methyltransferase n=1 Tax=Cyanophyceae TaxID=3028117 RepID=UPI001689DAB3|nr:methyltransferase domain-containing protein [Coleofasciculus sp. FACHB-125]MBD1898910.1 methyltransferase domain-containing protein [Coleofasciculus sp. FACHB-125]
MNSYKQQVIEFYNSRTAYDFEEGTRHLLEANLLLEFVPIQKGDKILDVATGTGLVAIPAAQKVGSEGNVIGIDMSPGMLHQARVKVEAACLQNIELIEADAESINFNDGSFDAIFCCEAIILFTDIPASLKKWYRFLKTGGFVAFTCPPETAYLGDVYRTICARILGISLPHILETLGTPEKCRDLLQQAGFRDIEIKIEPSGRYRNIRNDELSSKRINLSFKGNPLLTELSPEQLERFQVEYRAEIDKLATEKGVWEDTTKFFVRGRK